MPLKKLFKKKKENIIGDLIWVKDEDEGKIYFMMELDIENPEDITKMDTVTLRVKKH